MRRVSTLMENTMVSDGQHDAAADLEKGLTDALINYHQRHSETTDDAAGDLRRRVGKVPLHVRSTDDDGYTPRFVSIGPIHHDNETLRRHSHDLKVAYLHALIARRPDPVDDFAVLLERALDSYRAGVMELEKKARAFYTEAELPAGFGTSKSKEFVEMLVLDGCFLLEHMLNCAMGLEEPQLYSTHWAPSQLHADLIRFENQIPFFVLDKLLRLSPLCHDFERCRNERGDFLRSLAVHCLLRKDDQALNLQPKGLRPSKEVYHMLHMYSLSLTAARLVRPHAQAGWGARVGRALWRFPIVVLTPVAYLLCAGEEEDDDEEKGEAAVKLPNIPSATDLQRVGIKFKRAPRRPDGGFLDVRLEDGDTLVIPKLNIEQFTAPQLQNLIALEQATPQLPDDCSCYAFFMDNLVANPADVALLEAEGILKSNLGSHKEVVTYFNTLCRGNKMELEGNYLKPVFDEVMGRSKNPVYAWIGTLKKKYFSSPWGLVAVIVTIFVCANTILQTYISIMQYYHPR